MISALVGFSVLFMISYLIKKHPGKNLLEILSSIIGPLLAKFFYIYYIIFAVTISALVIYSIINLTKTIILTETPMWVFSFTFTLATGYIVKKGIEATGRCTEIIIPIILPVLLLLFIGAGLYINIDYLIPIFTAKTIDLLKGLVVITAFPDGELFLLAGIAVYVKKPEKILIGFLAGFFIASLFLILRPVLSIGIFSVPEAKNLTFPTYTVVRTIRYGDFLERFEVFFLFTWFFVVFIKAAVCIFVSLDGIKNLLNLNNSRTLVYPYCLFLIPLTIKGYENYQQIPNFLARGLPVLDLSVCLIFLPLLVLLTYLKSFINQRRKHP